MSSSDFYNCFKYKVCGAMICGSMPKFLEMIKKAVKISGMFMSQDKWKPFCLAAITL